MRNGITLKNERVSKSKNTFRFPFDIDTRIFLGLAVIFFILSISRVAQVIFPFSTVPSIGHKVEKDVTAKIDHFKSILTEDTLIGKLVAETSIDKKDFERFYQLPYQFLLYKDGKLHFWTSSIATPLLDTFPSEKPIAFYDQNGYSVAYKSELVVGQKKVSAVAIIRVKNENHYKSEYYSNNYLVDDSENDFGIRLSLIPIVGAQALKIKNYTLYYIYKSNDFTDINDKNGWRLFFNALPLIFFGISIHTYFKVIVKRRKPIAIFLQILVLALVVRFLNYYFDFPTDFSRFSLFDSRFFATDFFNRSLGDTFINMCLLFWILLFYVVNVQGRIVDTEKWPSIYKKVAGMVTLLLMILGGVYLSNLSYELINDSIIDFDTTIISRMDLFSFVGILTFMVLFASFFVAVVITNIYLNLYFEKRYFKYILIGILYLLFYFLYKPTYPICYYYFFICITILSFLLDQSSFKLRFDFNSYSLLVWLVLFSAGGAFFLSVFITEREFIIRKEYAEKILRREDIHEEGRIVALCDGIARDSTIAHFFVQDNKINVEKMIRYISSKYIWSGANKFRESVHIFNVNGANLNKMDTLMLSSVRGNGPLSDSFLHQQHFDIFTLPSFAEKGYFAKIAIRQDGILKGYVAVKMFSEILDQRRGYSDFIFQDEIITKALNYNYSIGVYNNGILQTNTGPYIFKEQNVADSILMSNGYHLIENDNGTELWCLDKTSGSAIVVVKEKNQIYLFVTLFAYIFLIYFLVISLYILGNIIARSNLNYARFFNLLSFNLRLRIHFAILLVVLISFAAIGFFTSSYLINRVEQKSILESSTLSRSIHKEIETYLQDAKCQSPEGLDSLLVDKSTIGKLQDISHRYTANVNLFSYPNDDLIFSTEYGPYNSGLLSTKMNPLAKFTMKADNRELYVNEEHIGSFHFLASYSFLRNSQNQIIGVMHLPYISANTEVRTETTSLITTLINIYVFVFLISSLLALFISNSVSRPFKLIVKQFTQINLSKTNEPLKWNSSDEIGMLVKEYNRMLRKLENSTILLAKNERELAWREMAKQVAHEIKNPLTPMKLSMQMLERAIQTNQPNVTEMTAKVAKTIIEQINNLTLIATNFSNFAQLPEVKKENIILNEVLYVVTGMFNDSEDFDFLFLIPDYDVNIYADRGQLIRVFTNIIQNAIQSIPKGEKGNIALLVSKIKDNFVRVSISDNGSGISKELAKKLFQPYFTTKSSGTGLGLAMCKDIIEKFGGRIEFESVENEGTTFHIDLPLSEYPDTEGDTIF
jgi:two-component system nitrogen regulation sensor histidine kinase NtrY